MCRQKQQLLQWCANVFLLHLAAAAWSVLDSIAEWGFVYMCDKPTAHLPALLDFVVAIAPHPQIPAMVK